MLDSVHEALRALLYREARLPDDQLDIRFATPTGEWVSALTRPTVNFYLHDLTENTALRSMDSLERAADGRLIQHLAARRINLRYLVTVFFKAQLGEYGRDEWEVLWRVLAALMKHADWPTGDLPAPMRALDQSLSGQVAQPDGPRMHEVFTSLGLSPRPHLTYTLTVPLDLNLDRVSRLVLERDTTLSDLADARPASARVRSTWRVLGAAGQPLPDVLVTANTGAQGYTDQRGEVILDLSLEDAAFFTVRGQDGGATAVTIDRQTNELRLGG